MGSPQASIAFFEIEDIGRVVDRRQLAKRDGPSEKGPLYGKARQPDYSDFSVKIVFAGPNCELAERASHVLMTRELDPKKMNYEFRCIAEKFAEQVKG